MAFTAEQIAAEIAEAKAQKISLTQNPITGDRTFVRWWKPAAGALSSEVEALLLTKLTVVDPQYENGTKNEPGTWQAIDAGWNPKLMGYVQTLTIAAPLDGGLQTVSEDLFETNQEQQLFNQTAVPSLGTLAVGVLKRMSVAIDRTLKKWTVQLSVSTSKEVSISYTITKFGATEVHTIMRNQRPVNDLPVLPSPSSGRMIDYASSPSKNSDGTWNWHAVDRPTDAILDPGATITKRQWGYKYMNAVWGAIAVGDIPGGGDEQFYKWRMTVYVDTVYTVHSTAAAAWAAGQGTPDYMGHGRWLSVNRGTEHIFTVDRVGRLP